MLAARLHSLVRRARDGRLREASGLRFDPVEHTASDGRVTATLTPTEFRLLAALAGRPRRPLARRELMRSAWPHGAIVHDNTLDVYIARLRRKLRTLPRAPEIMTVHGTGYRLE